MTLSGTMHAYLWHAFGGQENLEYRDDVPIPSPKPGQVLIKVGACGCNNTDIWQREGAYGKSDDMHSKSGWLREGGEYQFPRIQGADISGTIVEVGKGVSETRIGERVLVNQVLYGWVDNDMTRGGGRYNAGYIGSEMNGGFAEYSVVPAENALEITNERLSFEEIAAMGPSSALTAYHMLNRGRVSAGETVLVAGASGGVGTGLVQLSRIMGAYVIGIAAAEKADRLVALGAQAIVDRRSPDLASKILEAAGNRPIDVVVDVVGGEALRVMLQVVRAGGRVVTAGAIAGPVVEFDIRTIYLRHLEFIGSTNGTRDEFANLVRLINEGRFKPVIGGIYDLKDLKHAQDDFVAKKFVGNLIVVPRWNG